MNKRNTPNHLQRPKKSKPPKMRATYPKEDNKEETTKDKRKNRPDKSKTLSRGGATGSRNKTQKTKREQPKTNKQ